MLLSGRATKSEKFIEFFRYANAICACSKKKLDRKNDFRLKYLKS